MLPKHVYYRYTTARKFLTGQEGLVLPLYTRARQSRAKGGDESVALIDYSYTPERDKAERRVEMRA